MNKKIQLKAKELIKPIILTGSLLITPENLNADQLNESCKKIEKILNIQKNIDKNLQESIQNIDFNKLEGFFEISKKFCKKPEGSGLDKELEIAGNELENFENFERDFIEYKEKYRPYIYIKDKERFDKEYFGDFFQLQKNFLVKYKKFLKNFTDEKIFSGNLTYGVEKGDTLFEIIRHTYNTNSRKKINYILEKLKSYKGDDKKKIITRNNKVNNNKNIAKLSIGDKIHFGTNYDEGKIYNKKETSEELKKEYEMGFLVKMYIKGNNFPLLLDPNRMFNSKKGSLGAWCAANNYELSNQNFQGDFPASYSNELKGQANAYKVLPQFIKNGGEILNTGESLINLVKIKNIDNYGKSERKRVKVKGSKTRKTLNEFSKIKGWRKEDSKNKPYFEFSKIFSIKKINKKWKDIRNPIDRIIKLNDKKGNPNWIGLKEKSTEKIKNKISLIHKKAKQNPGSFIFWHYTLTSEYPKIILEHFKRYLYKDKLTEAEKKIPAASFGSHYTYNLGEQEINYSLEKIQEIIQNGDNIRNIELNTSEEVTLQKAISGIIPGWNDPRSDDYLNKDEIFKNVIISLEKKDKIIIENLFNLWKPDEENSNKININKISIEKGDILTIKDVYILDEYLAQGRILPLTKLLCIIEELGSRFIPTEIVKVNDKYKKPVIPYFTEEISNTKGIELNGLDSPKLFNIREVEINKIIPELNGRYPGSFSLKQINQIFEYYNNNIANKNGYQKAEWNKQTGDVLEGINSIFYEKHWSPKGGKIIFLKQELNFKEIFERQVERGIYKKTDETRVKYFLEKIGKLQALEKGKHFNKETFYTNTNKINSTQQIPIFKFTGDSSLSETKSIISNSTNNFQLKKIDEIKKVGEELGIKFLKEITESELKQIQNITKDPFKQATLIGIKGYETGGAYHKKLWQEVIKNDLNINKNTIESIAYKVDKLLGLESVGSVGDFQINFHYGTEIFKNFFIRNFNDLDENLKTDFVKKIFIDINLEFGEYLKSEQFRKDRLIISKNRNGKEIFKIPFINKKIRKKEDIFKGTSLNYQNFEKKIEDLIYDKNNKGTDSLASYLFLEEKERNIRNYAKIYYGNEYYSIVSQETDKIGYNDDLRIGMIDAYRGDLEANIIRGQSYIVNLLLYGKKEGNENFKNEDIQGNLDEKFENKIRIVLKQYSKEISDLGIKYNDESIINSLKGYTNKGEIVYTKLPSRILGGTIFKKSMGKHEAENIFQIMKKLYQNKFGVLPPMFMGNNFKENYSYINNKGEKITPRGSNIEKIGKEILVNIEKI